MCISVTLATLALQIHSEHKHVRPHPRRLHPRRRRARRTRPSGRLARRRRSRQHLGPDLVRQHWRQLVRTTSCAMRKTIASSDGCFRNTVLPIPLPIVTGLPILGGLRRRQAGLPVGSVVGLGGTLDSAVKGLSGDGVGILNGPLWYVAASSLFRCRPRF